MRLTDSLSPDTGLTSERERALPAGSMEIVYACQGQRDQLAGRPASQRRTPDPTAHLHPLAHGHHRAFTSHIDLARGTQIVPFWTPDTIPPAENPAAPNGSSHSPSDRGP
jgi:hypothetical protein